MKYFFITIITIVIFMIVLSLIILFSNMNSNVKQYYFNIYLISLEKDVDRRNNILNNIDVDDIYSVNGKYINRDKLIKDNIIVNNCTLKNGEIGCYLSHVHFLKKSLKNNNLTLLLEDDIDITTKNLEEIQKVIDNAPDDFEILFIGHNYYEEHFDKENYNTENYNYKHVNLVFGCQCYVFNNKKISDDQIQKLFPMDLPYDLKLPLIFKCYIVTPKIVHLNKIFGSFSNTSNIFT